MKSMTICWSNFKTSNHQSGSRVIPIVMVWYFMIQILLSGLLVDFFSLKYPVKYLFSVVSL